MRGIPVSHKGFHRCDDGGPETWYDEGACPAVTQTPASVAGEATGAGPDTRGGSDNAPDAAAAGSRNHYGAGRRVEHLVRAHLEHDGYDVVRAAGSKGKADLLAFKPGQMLVVQVKRSGKCGPAERAEVLRLASHIPGALALIASKPERAPIAFRRLTGPGPKDWTAWTSDEVTP